jgi:hypothetical protein
MKKIKTTEEFRASIRAARNVSTPLIAIRTADPSSALAHVIASLNGKAKETPLLSYDFITGLQGRNELGEQAAALVLGDATPQLAPAEVLASAEKLPDDSILFFLNPQRVWETPDVLQAIWNLRDTFKPMGKMLVLVTTVGAALPVEIQNDVMVFDEPLPSVADLDELITTTVKQALAQKPDLVVPDKEACVQAIDALIGIPNFPAETVLAMSLSKNGLNLDRMWERKVQAIEQTPGLTVSRGGEGFSQIGGCSNAKRFISAVLKGREKARVIVFADEIEKAFAGTGTDMSGVKTEMTGEILGWMQDTEADGILALGPPGCAKSLIAKAAGAEVGIPTIAFNLSAMQSGIVGSSGERLRTALQVIDAISQGRSLWIGTCNSITSLPPELRRRFQLGTFFFDLPDGAERDAIWKIYEAKWSITSPRPNDEGWTGAEIKECCRKAYRLNMTLCESADFIVPVSRSASAQIETLRKQASGCFLSASHPGVYTYDDKRPTIAPIGQRAARKFATE